MTSKTSKKSKKRMAFHTASNSDTELLSSGEQIKVLANYKILNVCPNFYIFAQILLSEKDKLYELVDDRNTEIGLLNVQLNTQNDLVLTLQTTVQALTEKLNVTKGKLFEQLNQNAQFKNELKIAQKCIQQEIGEHINLTTLASSNTTWRGRAQQIAALNNRIAELKCQIDCAKTDSGKSRFFAQLPMLMRIVSVCRAKT